MERFREWLLDELYEAETPAGDFARAVNNDPNFDEGLDPYPKSNREVMHGRYREYLKGVGAPPSVLMVFEDVWAIYEEEVLDEIAKAKSDREAWQRSLYSLDKFPHLKKPSFL